MSYSYAFSQFPTKDFNDLWDAFVNGTLASRVDGEVALLAAEEERVNALPMFSEKTFYEDREAFIQVEKNRAARLLVQDRKWKWEEFRKKLAETELALSATKDKKKIATIGRAFLETLREALLTLFVRDTYGYSESCKDQDYQFLGQLYREVHGEHLDGLKSIPSTETWVAVFRALKPEFATEQLRRFMNGENVPEDEREETKQRCLRLVVIVRNLLRTCLDRGWDLIFTSEFWDVDTDAKARSFEKSLVAGCVDKLVERRTKI